MQSEMSIDRNHKVVVNHEEQHSLWPCHKPNALGWRDAGFSGSKDECLGYVRANWNDMRPLSLRRALDHKPARQTGMAEMP